MKPFLKGSKTKYQYVGLPHRYPGIDNYNY